MSRFFLVIFINPNVSHKRENRKKLTTLVNLNKNMKERKKTMHA
jgi:hypothetical protein